jgi:hypothetical protein
MGEKIKIKEIEGDSDALASFFAASDCSLGEYLNANKKPKIDRRTFIWTIVLFLIILIVLWSIPSSYIVCKKALTLISLALAGCSIIFIHLYWRTTIVTIIGSLIAISLFMVAIDAMTPEEVGHKINDGIEQISTK